MASAVATQEAIASPKVQTEQEKDESVLQKVQIDCESGESLNKVLPLDTLAVWQLTSSTLGSGALVLPGVFVKLGWLTASLELLALAFLADAALQRLLDLAQAKGVCSYDGLAEAAAGAYGKCTMLLITIVCCFIGSLSYLGTAEDLLLNVLVAFVTDVDVNSADVEVKVLSRGKHCIMLCMLVVSVLPRCLSPTIGGNALISKCGVFTMIGVMLFFIVHSGAIVVSGCAGDTCGQAPELASGSVSDIIEHAATMAFSFTAVFALFPVLQDRVKEHGSVTCAVEQLRRPVRYSVLICLTVYLCVGLAGSFAYGSATKAYALDNLPLSNPAVQIMTFVMGVNKVLLVSIISFPLIDAVLTLITPTRSVEASPSARQNRLRPWVAVALGAAMVLVDTFLPFEYAFTLAGSLGLSLAAYAVPAVLYLILAERKTIAARWSLLTSIIVLCCGLLLLGGATPITFMRIVSREASQWQPLQSLLCKA